MLRFDYLLRRLTLSVLVLLGVLAVVFFVTHVVPADPAALYAGPRSRPDQVAALRIRLGLDQPLPVQFAHYLGDVVRGDFGESFKTKRPIIEDLKIFLPATLELVILAFLLTVVVGIPTGVLAAASRGRALDRVSTLLAVAGASIPIYWLALLAQLLFFGWLGWLPLGGRLGREVVIAHPLQFVTGFHLVDGAVTGNWVAWRSAVTHLILPVVVLATYPISVCVRMTRAAMIESLAEPFITRARAAGLPAQIILLRHALPNALLSTVTLLGLLFAYSITGSFLIELLFNWPGVGRYVTDAIVSLDFPVILAVTLIVTVVYVVVNLMVDLLQAALDPRIRLAA